MKPEDYRKDQQKLGQKMASQPRSGPSSFKKPFVAKGHDAFLKEAQDARGYIRLVTMSDGQEHVGKMIARDKFTITIEVALDDVVVRRTFYKHAIESFSVDASSK